MTCSDLRSRIWRCDACGKRRACESYDPDPHGEAIRLYLCADSRRRFGSRTLFPGEWLRLALRMGPQHERLCDDYYSRFGERGYRARPSAHAASLDLEFPSAAKLRQSPRMATRVGVVWDGIDYLAEHSMGSLRDILESHDAKVVYESLNRLSRRQRQLSQMQDYIHIFVDHFLPTVDPNWLRMRWTAMGAQCLGTLIQLSKEVLRWPELCNLALDAIRRMPSTRMRWEAPAWLQLLKVAPGSQRDALRDRYLRRTPPQDREYVASMLARTC